MPYIGKSPELGVRTRYYYTVSAGATSVSGSDDNSKSLTFSDGEYVDVYLNGVSLVAGTDYNTTTANTIAGLSAMSANDVVEVVVYDVFSVFSGDISGDLSVGGNVGIAGTPVTTSNYAGLTLNGATGGIIDFTDDGTQKARIVGSASEISLQYDSGTFNVVSGLSGGFTALSMDSTGAMTLAKQPAFLVKPASQQDNIATGGVTVVWGTEVFDQNADFSSNTFTAPVAGRYQLSVVLRIDNLDGAADYYRIGIITSNREYYYLFEADLGTSAGQDITRYPAAISILADMDASDTATVQFWQQGGTAQTDIITDSYFSGHLAC
jgi:hypothetical protein